MENSRFFRLFRYTLDLEAQRDYLQQLTERIQRYCARHSKNIGGMFCWSDLTRQMEWENGLECRLAMIDPVTNEERRMVGSTSTPASLYLKDVYQT